MASTLRGLADVTGMSVVLTRVDELIFYAEIEMRHHDQPVRIDARPSDAVALAVRLDIPIYVAEDLERLLEPA